MISEKVREAIETYRAERSRLTFKWQSDATAKAIPRLLALATGQDDRVEQKVHSEAHRGTGANVYWTTEKPNDESDGLLMKVPVEGGTPTVLLSFRAFVSHIVSDGINVHLYMGSMVKKVPIAGGKATAVTNFHVGAQSMALMPAPST
jgi:hypothetical protein